MRTPGLLFVLTVSVASTPADIATRRLIDETHRIIKSDGEPIWTGFGAMPLRLQLVEKDREILFCSDPVAGFTAIGFDPVTRCAMQVRTREIAPDVAGFSELAGQPLVQIGTPSALEMSAAAWTVTLLHESFHAYQSRISGYQAAVHGVGTTLGASSTSWFLTYPFPYAEPKVAAAFTAMTASARAVLAATDDRARRAAIVSYARDRRAAQAAVGARAWRYYEFQVGQEGVARWTELALAKAVGRRDPAIRAVAQDRWGGLATSLNAIDEQGLGLWKRSAFYVLGAIECEMLERAAPGWRSTYRRDPFGIGAQLDRIRQRSSP